MNVWRADADGSNLVQLTNGADGEDPVCSPDGKWVYYVDATQARPMRVPLNGGQPEAVPGSAVSGGYYAWGNIAISSNGDRLMYLAKVKPPESQIVRLKTAEVSETVGCPGTESDRLGAGAKPLSDPGSPNARSRRFKRQIMSLL